MLIAALLLVALVGLVAKAFLYIGPDPAPRDFEAEHRAAALRLWGLDTEPESNGWSALQDALAAHEAAKDSVFSDDRLRASDVVMAIREHGGSEQERADFRALVASADTEGLFEALDRMREADWIVSPTIDDPLSSASIDARGDGRDLARFVAAVAADAHTRGDDAAFVVAIGHLLALAKAQNESASVISYLVELAMEAMAFGLVHETLAASELGAGPLRELHQLLGARRPVEVAEIITCEEIQTLRSLWEQTRPGLAPRAISRAVQIERIESLFEITRRAAAAEIGDRAAILAELPDEGTSGFSTRLADLSVGALPKVIEVTDLVAMQFAAARLHVAIELYRAEHDAYPATLDALVALYFDDLPEDPRGPGGIAYRLIDASQDRDGRGFLLYAVGYDGVDDGGNHVPKDAIGKVYGAPGMPGYDYVFNQPRGGTWGE